MCMSLCVWVCVYKTAQMRAMSQETVITAQYLKIKAYNL